MEFLVENRVGRRRPDEEGLGRLAFDSAPASVLSFSFLATPPLGGVRGSRFRRSFGGNNRGAAMRFYSPGSLQRSHGDDDQIVPYVDAAPLSANLLRNGHLKTCKGFPHGMPTTNAETINADVLAFIRE
jgi:hypothetical protein